ncbi:hypothetical protein BD410DRAFT_162762 [Rickenella mellea]|uniref:Uncharacterized protein n=1 Tax=Rickenella mellea TaxID=50990 RepID=A0A4Y7Q864_9AGAM|nr:hypothetical protein BD410DRAFT_162762 [Rickenella mellea]
MPSNNTKRRLSMFGAFSPGPDDSFASSNTTASHGGTRVSRSLRSWSERTRSANRTTGTTYDSKLVTPVGSHSLPPHLVCSKPTAKSKTKKGSVSVKERVAGTLEALFGSPRWMRGGGATRGRARERKDEEKEWTYISRSPSPPSPDIRPPSGLGMRASDSVHSDDGPEEPEDILPDETAMSPFGRGRHHSLHAMFHSKELPRLPTPTSMHTGSGHGHGGRRQHRPHTSSGTTRTSGTDYNYNFDLDYDRPLSPDLFFSSATSPTLRHVHHSSENLPQELKLRHTSSIPTLPLQVYDLDGDVDEDVSGNVTMGGGGGGAAELRHFPSLPTFLSHSHHSPSPSPSPQLQRHSQQQSNSNSNLDYSPQPSGKSFRSPSTISSHTLVSNTPFSFSQQSPRSVDRHNTATATATTTTTVSSTKRTSKETKTQDVITPSSSSHVHPVSSSPLPPKEIHPTPTPSTHLSKILPLVLPYVHSNSQSDIRSALRVSRLFHTLTLPVLYGCISSYAIPERARAGVLRTLAQSGEVAQRVRDFEWDSSLPLDQKLAPQTHSATTSTQSTFFLVRALANMPLLSTLALRNTDTGVLAHVSARGLVRFELFFDSTGSVAAAAMVAKDVEEFLCAHDEIAELSLFLPPSSSSQVPELSLPPRSLPHLHTLSGPSSLLCALVPGRPVERVTLHLTTPVYTGLLRPREVMGALALSTATSDDATMGVRELKIVVGPDVDKRTTELVLIAAGERLGGSVSALEVSILGNEESVTQEDLYAQITAVIWRFPNLRSLALSHHHPTASSSSTSTSPSPINTGAATVTISDVEHQHAGEPEEWHALCPSLRRVRMLSGEVWHASASGT